MSDVDITNDAARLPPRSRSVRFRIGEFGWVWIGLVALVLLSLVLAPGTLALDSLLAILPFFAALALASVGQCLVIQQRGLDFSIPGVIAVSAITFTRFESAGIPTPVALLLSLGIAAAIGVVNSQIVLRLSITPLVATLATNAILIGAAFAISGGAYLTSSDTWNGFTRAQIMRVPLVVVIIVVIIGLLTFLMRNSVPGRRFVLVGASPSAARAAGIRVHGYQTMAYVVSALCACLAGLLITGFVGSATPQLGNPYLLATIAAVVIGGTPFSGGRGSLIATAGGALLLSQLDQLTAALGAPQSIQLYIQAAVLVLAVGLRNLAFGSLIARLRPRRPSPPRVTVTPTAVEGGG